MSVGGAGRNGQRELIAPHLLFVIDIYRLSRPSPLTAAPPLLIALKD